MENGQKKPNDLYKTPKTKAILSGLLIFAAGFVLAFVLGTELAVKRDLAWTQKLITGIHPVRENNQDYRFIYPLIYYDFKDATQFFEDHTLDAKINSYIQSQYRAKNAESISVSVRDFQKSRWAGVNQDTQYHPGSMMKVLIMMGYFREAQLDPTILQKNLVYNAEVDRETKAVDFSLPTNLTVGQSYPVNHLIEDMISNSDNGAESLLLDNVDHKILNQAYTDLSLDNPDTATGDYTISALQYMGFLRILYNSTYLSEQYSEQALSIMSRSNYKDGIEAGLPAGTIAAEKYGERVDANNNNVQAVELHDCGIVYAPNHTYGLCVMTKGADVGKLTSVIKDVSGLVYQYITSQK